MVLSFYIKSYFIIATGGIIYRFLSNLVGSTTPLSKYISVMYYEPLENAYTNDIIGRISGFAVFILFIAIVYILGEYKEKRKNIKLKEIKA